MSDTSLPAGEAPAAPPAIAPAPGTGRGWSVLAPLALALLSFALYAPTLKYELVYDDFFLIGNNASMTPSREHFSNGFTFFAREYWEGVNPDQPAALRTQGQALYRPLTLFLWSVLVSIEKGIQPQWPFHALNVVLNAWVVVMLYLLIRRLWNAPRIAFAAALLFALHPLHSEAVAYVAGLSDVLSAAAVLLGLLLWERATREPGQLSMGAYAGLMATFFIGLLAKEQTAVLIAAVALTDVMLALRGDNRRGFPRMAVYLGFALLLALHVAIRYGAVGYLKPSESAISMLDNPLIKEPFGIRLINGLKLLAMQIWLFLWPAKLSVDYSFNAIPTSRSFGEAEPLAGAVLVLALLLWGLVMIRRRPALGWGVLFFLGTAAFTSNILLPIGTLFGERLTYLPTLGLCLALAAVADGVLRDRRPGASPAAFSALGLVLLLAAAGLLGARTVERNRDFQSKEKLFEAAEKVVPESARVQFQLGALLGNQQLYTKAEEHYLRALEIDGTFVQAAMGLGNVYLFSKNWAKAIETYDRILEKTASTRSNSPEALAAVQRMVYTLRAQARAGKGDANGAAADLRSAMQIAGGTEEGVGPFLQFAQLSMNRGKPADAVPVLRQALALRPENLEALYMLARAASATQDEEAYNEALTLLDKTELGKPWADAMRGEVMYEQADAANDAAKRSEALVLLDQARKARPDLATPYVYRGRHLLHTGHPAEAILQLDEALSRAPRLPMALRLKAQAQLASGNPKDALASLEELELTAPDVECYTLLFRTNFELADRAGMERAAGKLKELGTSPVNVVLDLSRNLGQAGRVDAAIDVVSGGLMMPDSANDPDLLFNLAVLLIEAGRYDEALVALDQEETAQLAFPDREPDHFLPVNRARCYLGLSEQGKNLWMEAAAQLELFEQDILPETKAWVSLADYRAQLFLARSGPFYNPKQAADLAERALAIANMRDPGLLDRSIEALAATRDYAAALARAQEALKQFPTVKRYTVAAHALKLASDGDVPGAIAALRAPNDKTLNKIASQLEG
jgi:tetratricopeptide (TPR) repeat protein